MISNLILQKAIEGIKDIAKIEITIYGVDGKNIISTCENSMVSEHDVMNFAESHAENQQIDNSYLFKIYDEYQLEYVLVASGQAGDVYMLGKMAVLQIQSLLVAYKERFDKDSFIKNLLLDNLLLVDIYNRAKKVHIATNARRVVYILETSQGKDYSTLENVKSVFAGKSGDFITAVDERSIIVIKELEENDGAPELEAIAQSILNALERDESDDMHVA